MSHKSVCTPLSDSAWECGWRQIQTLENKSRDSCRRNTSLLSPTHTADWHANKAFLCARTAACCSFIPALAWGPQPSRRSLPSGAAICFSPTPGHNIAPSYSCVTLKQLLWVLQKVTLDISNKNLLSYTGLAKCRIGYRKERPQSFALTNGKTTRHGWVSQVST